MSKRKPFERSKREQVIGLLTFAGYHDDGRAFARLWIENRISHERAMEAFRAAEGATTCARPICSDHARGTRCAKHAPQIVNATMPRPPRRGEREEP